MANVFALVNGRDRELLFIRSLHQEKVGAGGEKTAAMCCTVQSFQAPEFLNPDMVGLWGDSTLAVWLGCRFGESGKGPPATAVPSSLVHVIDCLVEQRCSPSRLHCCNVHSCVKFIVYAV
jgi:hypothetical protein